MTRVLFPTVVCRWCEMQDQGSGSVSQSVSSAAAAMSISYPVNFIKNANCGAESAQILQTAARGVRSGVQTREHLAATSSKQGGMENTNPAVSCSLHVCGGCSVEPFCRNCGAMFRALGPRCSIAPSESYQFIPGQNTPNTAQ